MEAHQLRVVQEKEDLDDKINKLTTFTTQSDIFKTLDSDEKVLLNLQLLVMTQYSDILGRRIQAFSE